MEEIAPWEWQDIEKEMAKKFVCAKCGHKGGLEDEVAMTGTGLSKLFDIQHNEFLAISCTKCGYTELYNLAIMRGKDYTMDILDILFG